MKNTMKLAIETYAALSGYSFQYVVSECMKGNQDIVDSVQMLMFSVAQPIAPENGEAPTKSEETGNYTKEGKNYLTRDNEVNVIAYAIQNSDDRILARTSYGVFIVATSDGVRVYTEKEMEEVYCLDLSACDFERLGWTA